MLNISSDKHNDTDQREGAGGSWSWLCGFDTLHSSQRYGINPFFILYPINLTIMKLYTEYTGTGLMTQ